MPNARHITVCERCQTLIKLGDRYVIRQHHAIHATCAPGGDDE